MAPANDNEADTLRQKLQDYKDMVKRVMVNVMDLIHYLNNQKIEIQESNGMLKKALGALAAFVIGGVIIGIIVWNVRSPVQVAATPAASTLTPTVTTADIKAIVDDSANKTGAKIDEIKVDFNNRFAAIDTARTQLAADLKARADATDVVLKGVQATVSEVGALADKANTTAMEAKTAAATADKKAVDAQATADQGGLARVQTLANALSQLADEVKDVKTKLQTPGTTASAATPATAAPATTNPASPTSFNWPAKLTDRQTLVYAKCAGQDWADIDGSTSNQLLSSYTAEQAAKFFSDSGDCQGFITQAVGVSKIRKQLEAQASQPEQPAPASLPASPNPATSGPMAPAMAPVRGAPQAAGPVGRGCPALGSPDFYRLNPKPEGDGWEMVATVPHKPCGGWHRKRFATN